MRTRRAQAQSERRWWEIRAAAEGVAEIWLYSDIGEDWWGDGSSTSARTFCEELRSVAATQIDLHIYSRGGDFFDGQVIYAALKNHPATITTYIDGLAASIAADIAAAGDHIIMSANAWLMIHQAATCCCGTATDLREFADWLDRIDGTQLDIFEARSALTRDELKAALEAESWYDAAQALEAGLVDEIGAELEVAAAADLSVFTHAPAELVAVMAALPERAPEPVASTTPDAGSAPVMEGGAPSERSEVYVKGLRRVISI